MPAIQVSEFSIFKVGDATNTLQELSQYTSKVNLPTESQPTDLTTFPTGGGQVTSTIIRGPKAAAPTAEGPFSDAVMYILNQIMAARGGSTWLFASGNNAPPVPGDMAWMATVTLFDVEIQYNVGSGAATWKATWHPSDPGAVSGSYINPGFYPY